MPTDDTVAPATRLKAAALVLNLALRAVPPPASESGEPHLDAHRVIDVVIDVLREHPDGRQLVEQIARGLDAPEM